MQLHQLKYIREIVRNDLSISKAAKALGTSQPSVSTQLQQLEEELRLKIFERRGKRLIAITPMGETILEIADRVIKDVSYIENLADEILQGTPREISLLAAEGEIDIAIATETLDQNPELITFPCYDWNRTIVVPERHTLLSQKILTLEALSQYPILTYMPNFTGRGQQDQAFIDRGLKPNVVFTATDADVIKKYVGIGLGVGIIASMAFDEKEDKPLKGIDASHLFKPSTSLLAFRRSSYLRGYAYSFIELFAPHLTKDAIQQKLTL